MTGRILQEKMNQDSEYIAMADAAERLEVDSPLSIEDYIVSVGGDKLGLSGKCRVEAISNSVDRFDIRMKHFRTFAERTHVIVDGALTIGNFSSRNLRSNFFSTESAFFILCEKSKKLKFRWRKLKLN